MHITIKILSKACFTFLANKRFGLLVHLLDVLAHVAEQPKLLVAPRKRAREGAIFSVQAHMADKLRLIRKHSVAITSILALEKSRAFDVAAVRPTKAENNEVLTARECVKIF